MAPPEFPAMHGCHRTWNTWINVNFLRKSVKTWKSQGEVLENVQVREKSGNYFWATLDRKHSCSKMGVATHCPLAPWSGESH